MICPKCGLQNQVNSKFCANCGQPIPEISVSNESADSFTDASELFGKVKTNPVNTGYASAEEVAGELSDNSSDYVDPDESTICTLGNAYWQNIVYGDIMSSYAVLTQKRLYFCGRAFEKNEKDWEKIRTSKIVDIQDIRGTGFTYISRVKNLIIGILMLVFGIIALIVGVIITESFKSILISGGFGLIVVGIVFIIRFIMSRRTIFRIEYAGGQIGFDVHWLNDNESINFQRQIHLVKQKKLFKNGGIQ